MFQRIKFYKDFYSFRSKSFDSNRDFEISLKSLRFISNDNTMDTIFDRHYVYHTSWAVRKVKEINPKIHTDISSSLYFSALLSAFVPVRFYDYRPANIVLDNLTSKPADLTSLQFKSNSIKSLSCMHTVEHIGLGRYGEPVDPLGDIIAVAELKRVLAEGCNLLFVVPIGKPKIIFNAHRIYSKKQVLNLFNDLSLHEFTLIPDDPRDGHLVPNPDTKLLSKQKYGCGCFWFKKK